MRIFLLSQRFSSPRRPRSAADFHRSFPRLLRVLLRAVWNGLPTLRVNMASSAASVRSPRMTARYLWNAAVMSFLGLRMSVFYFFSFIYFSFFRMSGLGRDSTARGVNTTMTENQKTDDEGGCHSKSAAKNKGSTTTINHHPPPPPPAAAARTRRDNLQLPRTDLS